MSTFPPTYVDRAAINRANAEHSTGPRTETGERRSALNAVKHGLNASSPVLPTEDRAAYEQHRQQFFDEYKPATRTESQLVQELVDTSWRLNRVPLLEAALLARAADVPPDSRYSIETEFDLFTATHRLLGTLSLQSGRLSRQFNKALAQLREIQADRTERERRQLAEAAEILIRHQRKGLTWDAAAWTPADGFVFSKEKIERHAEFLKLQNPDFYDPPRSEPASSGRRSPATSH